jgi:uncharacterized protein HemX
VHTNEANARPRTRCAAGRILASIIGIMKTTTKKGSMLLWLIVLVVILGGAVYIKTLKQQVADLQKACPQAAQAI